MNTSIDCPESSRCASGLARHYYLQQAQILAELDRSHHAFQQKVLQSNVQFDLQKFEIEQEFLGLKGRLFSIKKKHKQERREERLQNIKHMTQLILAIRQIKRRLAKEHSKQNLAGGRNCLQSCQSAGLSENSCKKQKIRAVTKEFSALSLQEQD